jgi:hypothetical protein
MSTSNIKTDFSPKEKAAISELLHSAYDLVMKQPKTQRTFDNGEVGGQEILIAPLIATTATKEKPRFTSMNPSYIGGIFKPNEKIQIASPDLFVVFKQAMNSNIADASITFEKGSIEDLKKLHNALLDTAQPHSPRY